MKSSKAIAIKPGLIAALVSIPVFTFGLSMSSPANSANAAGSANSSTLSSSAPMLLAHASDHEGRHGSRGEGKHAGKRHHGGKHHRGKGMGMRMFRGLDLTEAQRDELFKLRHSNAPAIRDHYKKRRMAKKSMRELVTAAQFDQAGVDALAAEIGDATAKLSAMRAKMRFDMRSVLTDEQRTKLKERMQKRGKRKGRS